MLSFVGFSIHPKTLLNIFASKYRLTITLLIFLNIYESNAASLIMNIAYGINIAPKNDRYITIAQIAMGGMAEAANPGAFLVDFLPFRESVTSAKTRLSKFISS